MKLSRLNVLSLVVLLAGATWAQQTRPSAIKHFDDLTKCFDEYNTYTVEKGTFELLPPVNGVKHVRLSGVINKRERSKDVIQHHRDYPVINGALTVFIHTNEPEIVITSIPLEWDVGKNRSGEDRHLKELEQTVRVKCSTMEAIIKKVPGVKNFSDLVGDSIGGTWLPDVLNADRTRGLLYNDQGPPTRDVVMAELTAAAKR